MGPARTAGPGVPGRAITAGLRVTGAGLLIAAAVIHLDLYLTGYRSIPVIGGLFLLQVIVGFGVGVVVLATGSRVAAAAGAVFALATLGGYLLSVWSGLFGFTEVRTTAGIAAGVIEVAAFAALAALAARPRPSGRPSRPRALPASAAAWLDRKAPSAAAAIGGVSAVALVLLGVAAAGAGGPPGAGPPAGPAAAAVLKTTTINGTTVLTNGQGLTLYWFAPDTPARSACTGVCAQYWPPVTGQAGRARRHRAVGRDHPAGRLDAGHLRRTPAVHLRRRHRPRASQWQQPQPERWPVARSHRDPISPRQNTVATPALTPDGGSSSACPGATLIGR